MNRFQGTAASYVKFRPPYPDEAIANIISAFDLKPTKRVLDIGCGSGRLCIPLASSGAEIQGIDLDDDMLHTARNEAQRQRVENITFEKISAEDLSNSLGKFDVATFGSSFHWMDREKLCKRLHALLRTGGGIAILNAFYIWQGAEPWKDIVRTIITEYSGVSKQPGNGELTGQASDRETLKAAGFKTIEKRAFETPHRYTIESLLGFLASTSYASQHKLGDRAEDFESDIRAKLKGKDEKGYFHEIVDCTLITAHL